MNDFLIKNRFTLYFVSQKVWALAFLSKDGKLGSIGEELPALKEMRLSSTAQIWFSCDLILYYQMLNRRIINILTVHKDGLTQKSKKSGVVFRRGIILSEFFINKQSININQ